MGCERTQESTCSSAYTSDRPRPRRGAQGAEEWGEHSPACFQLCLCWPLTIGTHTWSACHPAGTFLFIISASPGSNVTVQRGWGVKSDYSQCDMRRRALMEGATSLVWVRTLITSD